MSTAEYKKAAYDRIGLVVKKGKREEYQQHAARIGLSVSEIFKLAVDEFIARHADETVGASTKTAVHINETGAKAQLVGEIPIIYSEGTQPAQNQPVSTQVQSIKPAAENTSQRITGNDRTILDAVNALTPESKKALLKFLQTLQG